MARLCHKQRKIASHLRHLHGYISLAIFRKAPPNSTPYSFRKKEVGPNVGDGGRSFGVDGASLAGAVDRYRSIVKEGWPMPSIAGGIYAGQLQAYYELLGPDV